MCTIYKTTLHLKTILLKKKVFLKRSVLIVGIAEDLFLKLHLVVLISEKLVPTGWFATLVMVIGMVEDTRGTIQ